MITADNLGIEFSAKPLFSGASFVINKRERVALTGKNGAGKSTLLQLLAGELKPSEGLVSVQRGISIGYLPQVVKLSEGQTVMDETRKAFADLENLRKRVERLSGELAARTDYDSAEYLNLVEEFSNENERLTLLSGENMVAEMERTLKGLGFEAEEFTRPVEELSGGWRMRIELAKLLLRKPDVLLLDEPTNHLDIESIRWLEGFLMKSGAAVVLVSHDRAFLNNLTNRTLEISCGKIVDYKVSYDEYLKLRAERREQQLRAFENQQREMAEIRDFVERFRYKPTKASQVQSRLKQLEKMVPVEVDEVDTSHLHLKFPPCERSGDFPLICHSLGKSYGSHTVFHDVEMTIRRGEKVAFVGKNGEGKSTLVKCIMRQTDHEGELRLGHNVSIGYYAQNQAQLLDENLTVFDTIDRVARGEIRLRIRDILGAFMFGGEASEKKVKVLSGGERSRLAMISLLLEKVNFLILDEPTNHLDMQTKDVLKEAIRAFDGTAIIVSHDRDFLDGLVERVYEFGGGLVREHIGGIYDFLRKKDLQSLDELHIQQFNPLRHDSSPNQQTNDSTGRADYELQKQQARERRKAQRHLEETEAEVGRIEAEIKAIEDRLAAGDTCPELFQQHGKLTQELQKAMEAWEKAMESL